MKMARALRLECGRVQGSWATLPGENLLEPDLYVVLMIPELAVGCERTSPCGQSMSSMVFRLRSQRTTRSLRAVVDVHRLPRGSRYHRRARSWARHRSQRDARRTDLTSIAIPHRSDISTPPTCFRVTTGPARFAPSTICCAMRQRRASSTIIRLSTHNDANAQAIPACNENVDRSQSWLGALAVKSRRTRSCCRAAAGSGLVVRTRSPRRTPAIPQRISRAT